MEIRHLEAFIAVAHEGSFTRAAERLGLTQPSLSARIQQLERVLNSKLFTRHTRPVSLTPVGEIFLPYAERVLSILDAGYEAVRLTQIGSAGRLTVGCPVSVSTYLMPQVVTQFNRQYPLAELFIETSHSINLIQQLLDGALNLSFTAAFPHLVHQTKILLHLRDQIVAAVPDSHPLAQRAIVSLEDLWGYRLVHPRWGAAFERYIDNLRETAPSPQPMIHVPLAAALPMTQQHDTITFLPRRVAEAIGLIPLTVEGFAYGWDMALVTRTGHTLTQIEQSFVRTIKQIAASDAL